MDLGLPLLDEARTAAIPTNAIAAADLVEELVAKSSTWPLLRDALRTPADLTATVTSAWLPTPSPVARWGRLRDLPWLAVEEAPGLAGPIQSVELETGIFGTGVVATGGRRQVHLRLSEPGDREIPNEQLAGALLAYVRGLATGGAGMAGIKDAMAPISRRELMGVYSRATTELGALMDAYRDVRARIDGVVGEVI